MMQVFSLGKHHKGEILFPNYSLLITKRPSDYPQETGNESLCVCTENARESQALAMAQPLALNTRNLTKFFSNYMQKPATRSENFFSLSSMKHKNSLYTSGIL